jgi:hypothetical protein
LIGLEFVKNVDSDWKKHIKFSDGSPYYDDFCPLSGSRCRQTDCSFWNIDHDVCGYAKTQNHSILKIK